MKKITLLQDGLFFVPNAPEKDKVKHSYGSSRTWEYEKALTEALKDKVKFDGNAIEIILFTIHGELEQGKLYDIPEGYRVIHEMTEGWVPSYNNPDNSGCDTPAEPTGFVLLVSIENKIIKPSSNATPVIPEKELILGGKNSVIPNPEETQSKMIKLLKTTPNKPVVFYINNLRFELANSLSLTHNGLCLLVDAPPDNSIVEFQYPEDGELKLPVKIKNGMHFTVTRKII